jgi:hypothetical protein
MRSVRNFGWEIALRLAMLFRPELPRETFYVVSGVDKRDGRYSGQLGAVRGFTEAEALRVARAVWGYAYTRLRVTVEQS